jgi:hypothetical protein
MRPQELGKMKSNQDFESIWNEAYTAGMAAGMGNKPNPMIVGQEKGLFSGEIDTTKPMYFVADGCCGFAWIVVRPGNCSFANWAKKNKNARREYGGGTCVYYVYEFNQSISRKEAFASAFADVLRKHGIKAYSQSRMD